MNTFCGRRTMRINNKCYDISGKTIHEIEKLQNNVNKKDINNEKNNINKKDNYNEENNNDISIDGGVGTANNSVNKSQKKLKKLNNLLKKLNKLQNEKSIESTKIN